MKLDKFERRQFESALKINNFREHLHYSEYCEKCCVLTDISKLNIATCVCYECVPSRKFTKKQIEDAIIAVNKLMESKDD